MTLSTTTLLHEAYGWTQDGRALLYATKSDAGTSTVWLVGLGDGEVAGEPRAVVRDIRGFGVAIPLPLANVALEQWDAGGRALILSGGLGTNLLDIVWNSSHLEGTPTLSLD